MSERIAVAPYIVWDGNEAATPQDILDAFRCVPYPSGGYPYGCSADHPSPPETADDLDIIVAWYNYEDYSGSALVIYRERSTGALFQVSGGHCSCYELEGQWEPDAVSADELLARPGYASVYGWTAEAKAREKQTNDAIRAALASALRGDA